MATKILVTGGAGYIGAVLVPALLDAGYEVTVVDNFMYLENSLAAVCADPRFDAVRADVRVMDIMTPLLRRTDVIIPLAALVGAPICDRDPVTASTVNRDAVIELAKRASKDQAFLMPITNSGYGIGEVGEVCTEESPLRPISRYGRDKAEVERVLMERGNAISYRLATVFGMSPRMRIDLLVNDFTYRAVTDRYLVLFESHMKRNYIHVRDVARAFLHGLTSTTVCETKSTMLVCPMRTCQNWSLLIASDCKCLNSPFSMHPLDLIPTNAITSFQTRRSKQLGTSPPTQSTRASAS